MLYLLSSVSFPPSFASCNVYLFLKGYTPLHLCAERGYIDLMRLLIDHGARVRFTDLKPDDKVKRGLLCHLNTQK